MTQSELDFLWSAEFARLNPIDQILARTLVTCGAKAFVSVFDTNFRFSIFDDADPTQIVLRERIEHHARTD